jgi:hypothetical protein
VRQSIGCGGGGGADGMCGKYKGTAGQLHRMSKGHGYNEAKSWLIG